MFNWKDLSYAYLFRILFERRFIDGVHGCLHPEAQFAYKFILDTIQQYKAFPTYMHMRERFNLDWQYYALQGVTTEEITDHIKNEKVRYDVQETVTELQKLLTIQSDKPRGAGEYLKPLDQLQHKLFKMVESKVWRLSDAQEVIPYYLSGQDNVRIANYGLPTLDKFTGGIGENQYIVLYADTTQGKSTLARLFAGSFASQGKRALYFTLEESGRKSVVKTMSTIMGVSSSAIIENSVTAEQYKRLASIPRLPGEVYFVDAFESRSNAELAKWVYQYKPDVIFLDQIPLWTKDGSQDWKDIAAASRQLKNFTQNERIPIVALTQAVKKNKMAKLDEIGFAYAMAQDADVVIHIAPDEYGPGYVRKRITLVKNRDRKRGQSIDLKWDLDNGIIEEEVNALQELYGSESRSFVNAQPTNNGGIIQPVHAQQMPVPGAYRPAMGHNEAVSAGVRQRNHPQGHPQVQFNQGGGETNNHFVQKLRETYPERSQ